MHTYTWRRKPGSNTDHAVNDNGYKLCQTHKPDNGFTELPTEESVPCGLCTRAEWRNERHVKVIDISGQYGNT